jgi:hypothetical protein
MSKLKKLTITALGSLSDAVSTSANNLNISSNADKFKLKLLTGSGHIIGELSNPKKENLTEQISSTAVSLSAFKILDSIYDELLKNDKSVDLDSTIFLKDATFVPYINPEQTTTYKELVVFTDQILGVTLAPLE